MDQRPSPQERVPRAPQGRIFHATLLISALIAAGGIAAPDVLAAVGQTVTRCVFERLDWLIMLLMLGLLATAVLLALSPWGRLVLGQPGERPEFSRRSWLAMLFAAGMGTGLVFWGVAEPLTHFAGAPGVVARSEGAAARALVLTNFHWGLHAWAVYATGGLVLAFFGFRHGAPYLPGAPLRQAFPGRALRPVAVGADFLAVLAIVFGVAGSVGMCAFQIRSGLHLVAGTPANSTLVALLAVLAMVAAYMTSALSGLDRGIKWLSNSNALLALALALFVLVNGPSLQLSQMLVSCLGDYLVSVLPLSVSWYESPADKQWLYTWTLTNFIWWIAWAPFVGVFVARISRGRTIREFIAAVLLAPTAFSLVWFTVFGGTGLHSELHGAGGLAALVGDDASRMLFALLHQLPWPRVTSWASIALVFLFLVTSVDSATFVLAMLTDGGSFNPPRRRRLAWGFGLGALGAGLMLTDRIDAVRSISVLGAIPYSLVLVLQIISLLRALRREPRPG